MFGLRSLVSVAGKYLLNNTRNTAVADSVRCSSKNTYIPHSRGMFAHELGPRGNQYKPNVRKRIATYGLKTRLESRGGKQMLWRKIVQGPTGWINFVPATRINHLLKNNSN